MPGQGTALGSRAVEKRPRQRDHAAHEVGLDDGFADVAIAGPVGGHAAGGRDEAPHALRDEVLQPGEVGIAPWHDEEAPAHVVVLAVPIGLFELRTCEAAVETSVRKQIVAESRAAFPIPAHQSADPPRSRALTILRDYSPPPAQAAARHPLEWLDLSGQSNDPSLVLFQ